MYVCGNLILFTMDMIKIHYEANLKIRRTYGSTSIPENGYVVVTVDEIKYAVHFVKKETGWIIVRTERLG